MKRLLFLLFLGACAWSADVVIVANPSVKTGSVSVEELKQVFLGTKATLSDGSAVEPVLAQSGSAHEAFLKSYVGKSDPALRNHFKSLVFTGKGSMPKSFGTDAEIVAFVAKTKGAIGYLANVPTAGGVKLLTVK
jgi:ABC-type phosphate transport system substrate-binding protein